jgi:hypothetical protein
MCPAANTMLDINSGIECNITEDSRKYTTGLKAMGTGIENSG